MIKKTFVTATFGYGASIIGIGMLGVLALYAGVQPMDGDVNNLIPQIASTYLPPILICVFFVMIIGSLSSTADADMTALSSIMMADVYGQNIAGKKNANPKTMLLVGRLTMIGATAAALCFASMQFNILDLLVFVGAMWGALVFPVIASFYWDRVTNAAFSIAVIAALAAFLPVRFEWISLSGGWGLVSDILSVIGIGVVLALMSFGFFGLRVALIVGGLATVISAPFAIGFLHEYPVLSGSLVAYAVSTLVCVGLTMMNRTRRFDFDLIKERTGRFDTVAVAPTADVKGDNTLAGKDA